MHLQICMVSRIHESTNIHEEQNFESPIGHYNTFTQGQSGWTGSITSPAFLTYYGTSICKCGCLGKGFWLGEQKICICVFVYLCRCSIEQSKGGGRSKRGHCAICSSNTLTAAKCVLVTMVVLKFPLQSRVRSRSTITELGVFTVQVMLK